MMSILVKLFFLPFLVDIFSGELLFRSQSGRPSSPLFAMGSTIDHVDRLPTIEYSVKYHTRKNPAIKPLESQHRATKAMSAKFR